MQTLKVKKDGRSIRKCIELPDAYLDKELEITIRPVAAPKSYRDDIHQIYRKYPDARPFQEIVDPSRWEREIRSEW